MPTLDIGDNDLYNIPGTPPDLMNPPKGDAFALRSAYAMKLDYLAEPPMFKVSDSHYAATWLLHPLAPKVEVPINVGKKKVNIDE
jgi:oligopeptide transport system ATP-binding protein